jgi:thioredoxin 1
MFSSVRNFFSVVKAALLISLLTLCASSANGEQSEFEKSLSCGKACASQGKYEQARKDFETAVQKAPDNCEAHFLLGQVYCKLHNLAQGKQQLRMAIRVGRGSPAAQKANRALLTLPKSLVAPRSGPETRMIASMLGLTRQRGAGEAAKATVLDFYAPWCNPCRQLNAAVDKAKTEYGSQVAFMSINVDDPTNQQLIDQYDVSPIPTMVFLNAEGEVVSFVIGYAGDESVRDGIKKVLAKGG